MVNKKNLISRSSKADSAFLNEWVIRIVVGQGV